MRKKDFGFQIIDMISKVIKDVQLFEEFHKLEIKKKESESQCITFS